MGRERRKRKGQVSARTRMFRKYSKESGNNGNFVGKKKILISRAPSGHILGIGEETRVRVGSVGFNPFPVVFRTEDAPLGCLF